MKLDDITHINYAFFDVTPQCAVASLDPYADFDIMYPELGMSWGDGLEHGNVGAFQILKQQHPHLSIALSLGGWTKSTHFSSCAKTAAKRQTLINSALAMLERTGFDGIDVDWEYPVCCGLGSNEYDPADWDNYLLLLAEMRSALDAAHPSTHKELTIAMGMGPGVTGVAPKEDLGELLDAIYLMTYDYNGAWNDFTGHLAPLYVDPAYPGDPFFFIERGVAEWTAAVPKEKLVMGLASYGRSWYGTTELYDSASGAGPGTFWEPPARNEDPGYLTIDDISSSRFAAFERRWDDTSKVPYMTGQLNGQAAFITYEDSESIRIKARYAKAAGLAGMMWWEASEDKTSSLLLAANAAWASAPSSSTSASAELAMGSAVTSTAIGAGAIALGGAAILLARRARRQRHESAPPSAAGHTDEISISMEAQLPGLTSATTAEFSKSNAMMAAAV